MRAYHQSEIAHKKDTIQILRTILTTTIIAYAGLIGSLLTRQIDSHLSIIGAIIIASLVGVAVFLIVFFTNRKIDEDNKRYRSYRSEYVKEREIIGIEKDLREAGYTSAWIQEKNSNTTGFHHTKNIIRAFAWIVFIVSIIGAALVYGIQSKSNKAAKSQDRFLWSQSATCVQRYKIRAFA